MSEYQSYEFQAVDRRLDEKEMRVLRSYSTRASITPTSFLNEYSFGDFRGNADLWREKYFDGYLSNLEMTNGSRQTRPWKRICPISAPPPASC